MRKISFILFFAVSAGVFCADISETVFKKENPLSVYKPSGRNPFYKPKLGTPSSAKRTGAVKLKNGLPDMDKMQVSGIMKYEGKTQAMFIDKSSMSAFFLRDGVLYGRNNKIVAGCSGSVGAKTVDLECFGKKKSFKFPSAKPAAKSGGK